MKMSVRETRAHFATALDAAARGEKVTITKNGKPVAELGPPQLKRGFSFERAERVRKELGLGKAQPEARDEKWLEEFDDPALGREIFGLGDDWDPGRP